MSKLKFGFYWAASCGGCEIAVLDVDEAILDVLEVADVVFWPVAMDIKYSDVEAMEDGYMDVVFFNGGVRNEEQEHLAKLLRRKAKLLVAFGSCAHTGGIPGLANLADRKEIFDTVYLSSPSTVNPGGDVPQTRFNVPEGELKLPEFYNQVQPLDMVVDVDYYLPGCPPPADLVLNAIRAIAMLLKKQNPQADPADAWWPGGQTSPKLGASSPRVAACKAPPAAQAEMGYNPCRRTSSMCGLS